MRSALLPVLLSLGLAACTPTVPGCPAGCTGCCDAQGACLAGASDAACGAAASACVACGLDARCVDGACQARGFETALDFCNAWVDALVGFRVRCGEWSAAGAERYRSRWRGECARGEIWPGLVDGRARYEPTEAPACLEGVSRQSCRASMDPSSERCDAVVVGLVGTGGSCFGDDECVSEACDTTLTCPGRCVDRVALGQPVSFGQTCVKGAEPYQGLCTALVPVGSSCAATGGSTQPHRCVAGARCDASERCAQDTYLDEDQACSDTGTPCGFGLQCAASRCSPLSGPGESCSASDLCQRDLFCIAGRCAASGVVGAACTLNQQCDEGLFCNLPGGAGSTGACAPLHVQGQACTVQGGECAPDFVCTASQFFPEGTCDARLAAGATCFEAAPNPCARGLYCDAGTAGSGRCVSLLADGAACEADEACGSGRCGFTAAGRACLPPEPCVDPTP